MGVDNLTAWTWAPGCSHRHARAQALLPNPVSIEHESKLKKKTKFHGRVQKWCVHRALNCMHSRRHRRTARRRQLQIAAAGQKSREECQRLHWLVLGHHVARALCGWGEWAGLLLMRRAHTRVRVFCVGGWGGGWEGGGEG